MVAPEVVGRTQVAARYSGGCHEDYHGYDGFDDCGGCDCCVENRAGDCAYLER